MPEIRDGDVVKLRSGSPPMTVIGAHPDPGALIQVAWFVEGVQLADEYPRRALVLCEEGSPSWTAEWFKTWWSGMTVYSKLAIYALRITELEKELEACRKQSRSVTAST